MSATEASRTRSRFAPAMDPPGPDAAPGQQRKRLSREELTPLARDALFRAAAQVVGELGYAEATVARITAAAGVAQGTFYLYFPTRQSLFDELLSHARGDMLARVREQVGSARDFFEAEQRGMAAFLAYVRDKPGFLRILNEAEAVAMQAWRSHYDDVAERYRRSLGQAMAEGQVRRMDAAETKTAVYLMMGARVALWQRCQDLSARQTRAALGHYMRMVQAWLAPEPSAERP